MARRNFKRSSRSSSRSYRRSGGSRSTGRRSGSFVRGRGSQRVELVIRHEQGGGIPMVGPGVVGLHGVSAQRPTPPKKTF